MQTNATLLRTDETLATSSKRFELVPTRLAHLEDGEHALVQGQHALVEGQRAVVERLDRLVEAADRERTLHTELLGRITDRLDDHERRLDDLERD